MFYFAVATFLCVMALDNAGLLRGDVATILWVIVAILLAVAMLFQFVPVPFTLQRREPPQ